MRDGVYIKTFGCQMNEYDSSKMLALLESSHGLRPVDAPENARLLLMNTCSVREKAQEKLFSELGRWRAFKEADPSVVIAVGGCVASQEGELIWERAPFVDVVFGPQTLHRLPAMLRELERGARRAIDVSFPEIEKFDNLPPARVEGPSAYVSIMEGCSKYCSFCIVPYTRGEEFSRPFDDVITEVVELAARGVREVVLLGQNVNAYRGPTHDGRLVDLAALIRYVAAVDGVERIRFTTSHPLEFSPRLIATFAEVPELVSHVHLPVQSGSDRILAQMKRGHTTLEYKSIIRRLREARPDVLVSTDFIVGFPGESDDDFARTMDFIEDVRFDQSFSFIYSQRPGTPAATLPDDVTPEVKRHRLAILQRRITEFADEYNAAMVGTVQRVLVTGHARKDGRELAARSAHNRVVNFAGDAALIGDFADVTITAAQPNSLRGELVTARCEAHA
ncbi:MAG: tRNA (N6-isopentenyl adenosine(37)-C2)-methylthiotransferase MiaB [Gammaproteobacteria bacterium]